MEISSPKIYKKFLLALVMIGAIFALAFVMSANRSFIYAQLDSLNLIPREERFTELYFENHDTLPQKLPNANIIYFAFTIHNLQGKDINYRYVVALKNNSGQISTIADNLILIKDKQSKTVSIYKVFATKNIQGTIIVDLPELNQQIHFSLANNK